MESVKDKPTKFDNFSERGFNLAKFRKKLNLTQKQFGAKFGGLSWRQIHYYEKTGNIPATLLDALQRAGHDIRDIVAEPSEEYDKLDSADDTEQIIEELLASGDDQILQHLKRQVLLLKDLLDYRRGKR